MYRQGDILLVKVEPPLGLRHDIPPDPDGKLVLARGERTGHDHAVKSSGMSAFEINTWVFLCCPHAAELVHDEHAPISLEPGFYRVIRQRTFLNREELDNVSD